MRRSVRLAREAADMARPASRSARTQRWVAASVGPYGAALADGSEYRGDYGLTVRELREWHRPRLEILADSGADVLALETIPCLAEAEALLEEVRALGVPAWLSMTCARGRTRNRRDRRRGRQLRELCRGGRSGCGCGGVVAEAGRGLPQQRGELGRAVPRVGRHCHLRSGARRRLGRGGGAAGRRLLPSRTRGDQATRAGRATLASWGLGVRLVEVSAHAPSAITANTSEITRPRSTRPNGIAWYRGVRVIGASASAPSIGVNQASESTASRPLSRRRARPDRPCTSSQRPFAAPSSRASARRPPPSDHSAE